MPAYHTRRVGSISLTPLRLPSDITREQVQAMIDETAEKLKAMAATRERASEPLVARGRDPLPVSSAECFRMSMLVALRLKLTEMERDPSADEAHLLAEQSPC